MTTLLESEAASVSEDKAAKSTNALPSWAFYAVALGVVLLDQATKAWTIAALPVGGIFPIWPGVFQIMHTQNRGMAFSFLDDSPIAIPLLAGAALLVAGGIIFAERRMAGHLPPLLGVALALPLGGALGNLIDRLRLHYVTDLFDFRLINFPVFNIADAAITVGVALLLYLNLFVLHETVALDSPKDFAANHEAQPTP